MMADLTSLNVQMQKFLKDEGHYKNGALDGKLGPNTHRETLALLKEYKIPTKGWTKARALIALEQLFYKSLKIEVGAIDGKVGPQTLYARETFEARQTTTWRDTAEKIAEVVKPVPTVTVKVSTPKKTNWPTQSQCTAFYGKVGTNQVSAVMPYPMRIAWDTKNKITKFSCHKLVKEPIERIFARTLDYYGYENIKALGLDLWGGCLNVRKMRGGSSYSMHSWGIAVDMDPDRNQLKWGKDKAVFAKPVYKKFWEFVYDEGAISLGIERNYDFMHFQFARLS
jgi:hypothetical protein